MRRYQIKIICHIMELVGFVGLVLILINQASSGKPVNSTDLLPVLFIGTVSIIDSIMSCFTLDANEKEKEIRNYRKDRNEQKSN